LPEFEAADLEGRDGRAAEAGGAEVDARQVGDGGGADLGQLRLLLLGARVLQLVEVELLLGADALDVAVEVAPRFGDRLRLLYPGQVLLRLLDLLLLHLR